MTSEKVNGLKIARRWKTQFQVSCFQLPEAKFRHCYRKKGKKTLIIYDNCFCWASCTYFFIRVTSVESNCHFLKNFTCSTGFKSYTVKVFASKILFIVREINLETSGWGKIRLAVLLHELLVVFIEKTENEIGIKRAVNRFLWDCCDRAKEIKPFMTETPKCDCQKKHFSEHNLYFIKKSFLVNYFQK